MRALARIALISLLLFPATAGAQRPGPSLVLGGDVLYDAPLEYQLRRRSREVGRENALREVFVDLAPTLRRGDLTLVNLEVPISPRYRQRDEHAVFRAPEDFLDALVEAGVDAVTVANNHAYDQGLRGLQNTLAATRARDLTSIGAGPDSQRAADAVVVTVGGARIAVAAWTEGSNHRIANEEGSGPRVAFLRDGTMAESLRRARPGSHLLIAVFHWTAEDLVAPRPVMRRLAREAAEAGADLVVGHGTHLPGRREVVRTADGRDVPVLYSLGNLLAAMDEPAGRLESTEVGVRDAPLAEVSTVWRNGRLAVSETVMRHHWIARPVGRAPWMEGGRLAVSRPVEIAAELRRLHAADCGDRCAFRAEAYRRRVALMERAMSDLGAPPVRLPPERLTVASIVEPQRGRARTPSGSGSPPPRPARIVIADSDPRLAPYLRGVVVPVAFHTDQARERSADTAALQRAANLMREDRSLRCQVIAYPTTVENAAHPRLAALRARRVRGLLAMQGPSRSRFSSRAGSPGRGPRAGTSHVVIRFSR